MLVKGELVLALVFAALGALWITRAARMPVWGDSFAPDSGFLPLVYGVLLFGLSLAAGVQLLAAGTASSTESIRKPLLVLGALAAAVGALPFAGFALSVFGLLFFLYAALERLPLVASAVVSAAVAGLLYVVFKTWLGVPLP